MENNGLVVYFNCLRLIFQCLLVSLCPKANAEMFPILQDATARFSCSPPDLNFLDPYFILVGPVAQSV